MCEKIEKIRRAAQLETTNAQLVAEIVNARPRNASEPPPHISTPNNKLVDTSLDDLTNNSDCEIFNHSELSNSSVDSSFNQSANSSFASTSTNRNLSCLTVRFIRLFFAMRPINWWVILNKICPKKITNLFTQDVDLGRGGGATFGGGTWAIFENTVGLHQKKEMVQKGATVLTSLIN